MKVKSFLLTRQQLVAEKVLEGCAPSRNGEVVVETQIAAFSNTKDFNRSKFWRSAKRFDFREKGGTSSGKVPGCVFTTLNFFIMSAKG
jgi:hypothetical protein